MLRRVLLAITFVAALGAAGLATPKSADAWRWNNRYDSGYYYGGPRVYAPYQTYYPGGYGSYYYGPRAYYGPRYYGPSYGGYGYRYGGPRYYYGPAPRVALRVGW